MDKIKINNQVVLMRKYVKQAKVHIINKLVKEVKLLRNRKGNESVMEKAKRKAERFLEEIEILKKIKPDYVSKLALSRTRDWKEILEEKNASLDDRCLAMIANFQAVENEVEKFCCSNSDLIPKIPQLLIEWEEKSKFPKNSPKGSSMKKKNHKNIPNRKIDSNKGSERVGETQFDKNITFNNKNNTFSCENERNIDVTYGYQESETEMMTMQKMEHELNSLEFQNENLHSEQQNKFTKSRELSAIRKLYPNVGDSAENNMDTGKLYNDIEKNGIKVKCFETICHNLENTLETKDSRNKRFNGDKNNIPVENSKSTDVKLFNKQVSDQIPSTIDNSQSSLNSKITLDNISVKSNLKTITILNLDDLQELDEIPVNKSFESEEETSESDTEKADSLEREESDPFFLRCDEFDLSKSNNSHLETHPDNLPFMCIGGKSHTSEFRKYQKPNMKHSFKKNFQRPSNNLSYHNSVNSDNDRNNFKKDRFNSKEYQGRYQPASKRSNREEFHLKNPKNFREKKSFQTCRKDSHNTYSNKLKFRNETNFGQENKVDTKDSASKPLHPSWEAKRKQKELTKIPFQGKRVVFD